MALPTTGTGDISFSAIQTEFGGINGISLSEYYAGGSYVGSGKQGENGAIPTSGEISVSDFGGSNAPGTSSWGLPGGYSESGSNEAWVNPSNITNDSSDAYTSHFTDLGDGQLTNTLRLHTWSNSSEVPTYSDITGIEIDCYCSWEDVSGTPNSSYPLVFCRLSSTDTSHDAGGFGYLITNAGGTYPTYANVTFPANTALSSTASDSWYDGSNTLTSSEAKSMIQSTGTTNCFGFYTSALGNTSPDRYRTRIRYIKMRFTYA